MAENVDKAVIDWIKNMQSQGMNNNQIIQVLQREGYNATEIFNSLNKMDVGAPAGPQPGAPAPEDTAIRTKIEELAEVIIDEKWEETMKRLNKLLEWKDATEAKVNKMEQLFQDMKGDFDNLHKAIIGKIGEYDKNILNVGTEIKAMEKVFQKILPTLTENVSELSRITKGIKK